MSVIDIKKIGAQLTAYRHSELFQRFKAVLRVDLLVKATGFLLIPVYLRIMTQDEYGEFNFIVSIIQTIGLLLTLGLYIPQTKLYHSLPTKEERGSMLFTTTITLLVMIIVVLVPVYYLGLDKIPAAHFFHNQLVYEKYRALFLPAIVVTIFGFVLTYFLFGSERIKQIKAYNYWRILFMFCTLGGLYLTHMDKVFARLWMAYATECALILIFIRYLIADANFKFDVKILKRSLAIGLPIMVNTFFGVVVNFSDKFYLEKFDGHDLSTYYFAFAFASIIPLIAASLQNVWMPVFLKEQDLEKNNRRSSRLTSRILIFFMVIGTGIWAGCYAMVLLHIVPQKYAGALGILPMLILGQVFMAMTTMLNNYLIYFEKTFILLIAGFIVSVISIVLSIWLIPVRGMYGAALATMVANLLYLGVCSQLVKYFKNKFTSKPDADEILVEPVEIKSAV